MASTITTERNTEQTIIRIIRKLVVLSNDELALAEVDAYTSGMMHCAQVRRLPNKNRFRSIQPVTEQ